MKTDNEPTIKIIPRDISSDELGYTGEIHFPGSYSYKHTDYHTTREEAFQAACELMDKLKEGEKEAQEARAEREAPQ